MKNEKNYFEIFLNFHLTFIGITLCNFVANFLVIFMVALKRHLYFLKRH